MLDPQATAFPSTTSVIARWFGPPLDPQRCDECGSTVPAGEACPTCGQYAGWVGLLAAVAPLGNVHRVIVAERSSRGGWHPVRSLEATPDVVTTIRQGDALTVCALLNRPDVLEVEAPDGAA